MTSTGITVITHNGRFHSDEVLAYTILATIFDVDKLIRTRDMNVIDSKKPDDIVIDVGRKYDPKQKLFDHHQDGFNHKFYKSSPTPMSSAGLIWKHYGLQYLQTFKHFSKIRDKDKQEKVLYKIYHSVILEIDANDNGVSPYDSVSGEKFTSRLTTTITISMMNYYDVMDHKQQLHHFDLAAKLMEQIISIHISDVIMKEIYLVEDKNYVTSIFNQRFSIHTSGRVLYSDQNCPNFMKALHNLPGGQDIYFNIIKAEDKYYLTALKENSRNSANRFSNRCKILDMAQLKINMTPTEFEQVLFVHKDKFIAGTTSKEIAIKIASLSIDAKSK